MPEMPIILLNMAVDVLNDRVCDVLFSQYADPVRKAGGVPMLLPSCTDARFIEPLLDHADGVLLIGGKDYPPSLYGEEPHPETFCGRMMPEADPLFAKLALARKGMPILGICGGCQLLNITLGGKLIQHLPNAGTAHRNGVLHPVHCTVQDGWFAKAVGGVAGTEITVKSFHHQAVDPAYLGRGLRVTAEAFDGSVEAIEWQKEPGRMVLGVQFHPERTDDLSRRFFGQLIREAARYRESIRNM